MFKKTLLALAVAGVSVAANAATIKTSTTGVTEVTSVAALTNGGETKYLGAGNAYGGGDDDCGAIATFYGATKVLDGNVPADAQDDTAAFVTNNGLNQTTVTYTGAKACNVMLAPTLASDAKKDGLEYSTVNAVEVKPIIVAGIGGYKDEDTITIDLTGAKIDLSETTAPELNFTDATTGKAGAGTVSFDVLDISENQVRFTVQTTNSATDFVKGNAILELSKVFLDSDGLSNETSVGVSSFATNTSGTQFDPAKEAEIVKLVPQYVAEVATKLDAEIDVAEDRQSITQNPDTLTITIEDQTDNNRLTVGSVHYSITGDFSWMNNKAVDVNEDGKLSSAEIKTWVTASVADTVMSVNSKFDTLTIAGNAGDADVNDDTLTLTFKVPGYDNGKLENPMIPVQTFEASVTVSDKAYNATKFTAMKALENGDAGAWELNGSVIYVPYVPFGPNTQPILRHTNKGTRTGDITVRYMVEGEHTEWQALSAAGVKDATPGVRNMLGLVNDALAGEGYDSSKDGFKVALEIVTNVPSRDVFVYGGVKVSAEGQDRIHLTTTKTNN